MILPPTLDYATPKPNFRLRNTSVWLLRALCGIHAFFAWLFHGPIFLQRPEDLTIFVLAAGFAFAYFAAASRISCGSWRWARAAWIAVLLNTTLLLLALTWSVYDLLTSPSRYVYINFQIRLFLFLPSAAISVLLAFFLHRLIPQLKSPQPQTPTPTPPDDTISA